MTQAGADPNRIVSRIRSLDELIGAHPDALARIYTTGSPVDPRTIGEGRGRVLALVVAPSAFLMVRGLVRALSSDWLPWQGKVFDASGETGANLVRGRASVPFRVENGNSAIDGRETLILRYDDPAHGHPRPLRSIRDELREIAPGISIGPALLDDRVLGWWGLEHHR